MAETLSPASLRLSMIAAQRAAELVPNSRCARAGGRAEGHGDPKHQPRRPALAHIDRSASPPLAAATAKPAQAMQPQDPWIRLERLPMRGMRTEPSLRFDHGSRSAPECFAGAKCSDNL